MECHDLECLWQFDVFCSKSKPARRLRRTKVERTDAKTKGLVRKCMLKPSFPVICVSDLHFVSKVWWFVKFIFQVTMMILHLWAEKRCFSLYSFFIVICSCFRVCLNANFNVLQCLVSSVFDVFSPGERSRVLYMVSLCLIIDNIDSGHVSHILLI